MPLGNLHFAMSIPSSLSSTEAQEPSLIGLVQSFWMDIDEANFQKAPYVSGSTLLKQAHWLRWQVGTLYEGAVVNAWTGLNW